MQKDAAGERELRIFNIGIVSSRARACPLRWFGVQQFIEQITDERNAQIISGIYAARANIAAHLAYYIGALFRVVIFGING